MLHFHDSPFSRLVADESVLALGRRPWLLSQTSPQGCFRYGNWLCPGWVKWGKDREMGRDKERKQIAAFTSSDIYLLSLTHSGGGAGSEYKVLRFEGRNFKEFAETFLNHCKAKRCYPQFTDEIIEPACLRKKVSL